MIEPPAFNRAAFDAAGFAHVRSAIPAEAIAELISLAPSVGAGERLAIRSPASVLALQHLQPIISVWNEHARAVRCVLFDKSATSNWAVPWHQDRTIAVTARHDLPGYGPWSVKQGAVHVEPPFDLLAMMLTVRLHLDDCPADNAPLLVASGSHRLRHAAADAASIAATTEVVSCLATAGDVWLYATPILHASRRAQSPTRRRVLQMDFCAAGLPEPLAWAA